MNVDYDLYEGEIATASVRHTFSRGALVYDRGEIKTEPGHGRFVARTLGALGGCRVSAVRLDPQAVIADLDQLAAQSGGRFAGAERLAWTPDGSPRAWLRAKLKEAGLEPEDASRQLLGPHRRRAD